MIFIDVAIETYWILNIGIHIFLRFSYLLCKVNEYMALFIYMYHFHKGRIFVNFRDKDALRKWVLHLKAHRGALLLLLYCCFTSTGNI